MEAVDVKELYLELQKQEIQIWIDGGWGVDALLEKQTRPHKDLDIAINWNNVMKLKEFLIQKGYKEVRVDNKWNFVWGDSEEHEIDIHAFVTNEKGKVIDGILYPKDSLTGKGIIDGVEVKCIAPEYVVKFHSGYELKEKDYQDVSSICQKFGIELPKEYQTSKVEPRNIK